MLGSPYNVGIVKQKSEDGAIVDISSAQEAYLEALYRLEEADKPGRVRDIAERVGVHKSSATGALRRLRDHGLVDYEPYEVASLTDEGREAAMRVVARHEIIRDFLVTVLDIEPDEAESAARRMRHAAGRTVVGKLACFLAYLRMKGGEADELGGCRAFMREALQERDCEQWVREYLRRRQDKDGDGGCPADGYDDVYRGSGDQGEA